MWSQSSIRASPPRPWPRRKRTGIPVTTPARSPSPAGSAPAGSRRGASRPSRASCGSSARSCSTSPPASRCWSTATRSRATPPGWRRSARTCSRSGSKRRSTPCCTDATAAACAAPARAFSFYGAAGSRVPTAGGRMLRPRRFALLALFAPALVAPPAAAQETASDTLLTVDHYLDWEQVADPQISPDGAQIVYTRRWVNKLEDKWESALWIMNADGSHNRFLVKGSDARWAPDGTRILYLADGEPKGTQLFVRWMDAEGASSQVTRVTEKPADPRWAPDGKAIAFVMLAPDSTPWSISLPKPPEGAKWTPAPRVVENLYYRQDRVGYMARGFNHPGQPHWAPDGKGVFFQAGDRGSINVHYADLAGGVRDVTQGAQVVSIVSLARSLVGVGVGGDAEHAGDIVRMDLRRPGPVTRLTMVNDDVLANKRLAKVEGIWYGSCGGARIRGWIVKPPSFEPAKKYPLILEIHGGPFAMYNVGFAYMFQNFAANGYVVLYVNPRGSTGYGDAFSSAIDHNYPGPDYDDLMAGVDAVIGKGYVDTTRMYVSGCSGGGVLSSWVIGHTSRFAAAAVRCPVIDWVSMAGETDIPLFTYSFFHQPFWDKPDEWLAHSSLMQVGHITTPTLLMTGELDRRTPIPQTEEFYSALKVRGVPTVMLRFADEYHGTGSKPSNFMRTQLYMMSWFQKYRRPSVEPATGAGNR